MPKDFGFQTRKYQDPGECDKCGTLRTNGYPATRIDCIFHYKENPGHQPAWFEKIVREIKT